MKRILKISLFALLLFNGVSLFSQNGNSQNDGQVTGVLQNSTTSEPVMYAAIALLSEDSTILNSAISTPDGSFKIENVEAGSYLLQISHLEYNVFYSDLFTFTDHVQMVVPDLILNPSVNSLGEVVVTASKPLIEVKADKLIFNVASSPSASGTNGLELLKKSPGVALDLDNNISLLGKANVQVYLNGVQSRLSGNDLTAFLQSISSDMVELIEIISNPSAKYDAEGTGGIINIVLKNNMATGFNGSILSNFSQGIEYNYRNSIALNFGFKKVKTNFDFTQSYSNDLEYFIDSKQQNNSILDLYSKDNEIRNGYNIGINSEAQIAKNHSLNLSARAIFNSNMGTLNSNTDIYQANPFQHTEFLASQSIRDGNSTNYIANLNHIFKPSNTSNLSSNISVGTFTSQKSTQQPNTYFEPTGEVVIRKEDKAFDSDTHIDLWSAKMDYEKEWQKITLSAGAKYAHIITKNTFDFYSIENDQSFFDKTKSNDFNYTESVTAFYANLQFKLNDFTSVNAGMRAENTNSRGVLLSDVTLDNSDVKRNYLDFFPNVSMSLDKQKNHAWSFSVGRRITRPNYQDLNPFESPSSQLIIWKGNPFLKPNYIMNYQVTYAFIKKLVVTVAYSETTDFFSKIVERTGEETTQIIPRNLEKATNIGVSASYPFEVTKFWDAVVYGNAGQKSYKGNVEGTAIDLTNFTWNYRIQNKFYLPADILLDVTFFQQSSFIWRGSVLLQGNYRLSFGVRKDFLDGRLQVRITGNDILNTGNEFPYFSNYGGILLDGVYRFDSRNFGIGATFKFGNQKAKTTVRKNSALDDELDRIES